MTATKVHAAREERAARAFDMRVQGMSESEIGRLLGVHRSTISRDIDRHLERLIPPKVEAYRKLYDARYEALLNALSSKASKGDVDSVNASARLLAQLSKLHGVDSPVKSEKTVSIVTPADIEIRALVEEMQAKNDAVRQELA